MEQAGKHAGKKEIISIPFKSAFNKWLSALFDFLKDETILTEEEFTQFYEKADELSQITPAGGHVLFRMIGNLTGKLTS